MSPEETLNHEPLTANDREFALLLAGKTEELGAAIADRLDEHLELTRKIIEMGTATADVLEMHAKQLDHIDVMIHEIHQFITEHKPALTKALTLLDPGRSMREYLGRRRKDTPDG